MPDKILYVDDESDIREIAQMSLEIDPEFEVRTGSSGREGLVEAAEWQPDLIMLDVMMPGMDGPETLRRLRASAVTAAIPVVFITARTQDHQIADYKAMGAADVLAKPFDPMALAGTVRSSLNRIRTGAPS